jgi:hypothetical protein
MPSIAFRLMRSSLPRLAALLLFLAMPGTALAEVNVSFQSFNGSFFSGRYPHTFVVFEGRLQNKKLVKANYGFSAEKVTPEIISEPVKHMVISEKSKWIGKTNRHFTVTVSDAVYFRMMDEVAAWRNAPGKFYHLNNRNCIHFVGAIAQLAGIRVDYPKNLMRDPKGWLNRVGLLNPQLHAHYFN